DGRVKYIEISGLVATEVQETLERLLDRVQARPELAHAMSELGQATAQDPTLDEDTRRHIVRKLDELSKAAATRNALRKKRPLQAAIASISAAATAGTKLHETWAAWGPEIEKLLR